MLSLFISCASSLIRLLGFLNVEMVLCGKKSFLIAKLSLYFSCVLPLIRSLEYFQVKTIFHRKLVFDFEVSVFVCDLCTTIDTISRIVFWVETIFHRKFFLDFQVLVFYLCQVYNHWYDV